MTELVERVARAMVPLLCGSQEDRWGNDLPDKQFEDLTPDWQERHKEYARAAITEIMDWLEEPSEAAMDAVPDERGTSFERRLGRRVLWQAMLVQARREALGEQT